ncbi:uncharacterized protein FMAN_08221 [Fusarium mangiferae]|uniref:Uncharacterized protein n=1 Tax=Fusarium mangiferae TaxID=192010 RepID=A0A1L7TU64_FUSMA|nr:uncharacterized protein FMAN_08221 [Fusarium mangiferae]CVL02108.1 uncharacterized protein FMAN_08221 [Fusarium mangiferae]
MPKTSTQLNLHIFNTKEIMPSGSCTKTNQGAAEWSCKHDIKLELINDKGKFEDALRVIYPLGFKVNYKYSPSTCRVIALAKTKEPTDLQRKLQDVGAILQGRFGRRR